MSTKAADSSRHINNLWNIHQSTDSLRTQLKTKMEHEENKQNLEQNGNVEPVQKIYDKNSSYEQHYQTFIQL